MKRLARHFGQDEEGWGLAGLLHDLDWEQTKNDPTQHTLVAEKILSREGLAPEIVRAVKVHNFAHGIKPETLLEKALFVAEELTGLITACSLVNPQGLAGVKISSVKKKFKDNSFARGVERSIIAKAPVMLGLSLEELIELELEAMKAIGKELGLNK